MDLYKQSLSVLRPELKKVSNLTAQCYHLLIRIKLIFIMNSIVKGNISNLPHFGKQPMNKSNKLTENDVRDNKKMYVTKHIRSNSESFLHYFNSIYQDQIVHGRVMLCFCDLVIERGKNKKEEFHETREVCVRRERV